MLCLRWCCFRFVLCLRVFIFCFANVYDFACAACCVVLICVCEVLCSLPCLLMLLFLLYVVIGIVPFGFYMSVLLFSVCFVFVVFHFVLC